MDWKTGKHVRQVVLLNRRESPQERNFFLDNLSRNSKFQNLLGRRLYPSNQELGARELMGLILAARTDSSGSLRYVSSTATNPLYSRALHEIANPGQKITDGEYALKDFNEDGFKAQIVYVRNCRRQMLFWIRATEASSLDSALK